MWYTCIPKLDFILKKLFYNLFRNNIFVNKIKFPQYPGYFTANSQDFIILFYFRAYADNEDSIEVCLATEHEERMLLVEYLEKLKLYEKMLPDPLEREKDSWMSKSQGVCNWPSLYYHVIAKYLDHLAPTFISQLESEYKLGKAYRYFSCEFVREMFYFDLAIRISAI